MKAVVVGIGKMGKGVAWDLIQQPQVQEVGIVDADPGALTHCEEMLKRTIKPEDYITKLVKHKVSVSQTAQLTELMTHYDVGIITLPNREYSYKAIEAAIDAKLNVVDILEEYHRRPDVEETEGLEVPEGMTIEEYGESLHQRALEQEIIILDGMGFAPGLSNVTLGEGIRKLDKAESAIGRVGGIPSKESSQRHPLGYVITWAFEHVLREYMIKVKVIQDGKIVDVDALSGYEKFGFTQLGKDEKLECAITPGMPSFIYSRPELTEFAEKTVRWPGHFAAIDVLKECGLLDLTGIEFNGTHIIPREFVSTVIQPKLRPVEGDVDVCVMWNTVKGVKNEQSAQIDYYMWEKAFPEKELSAMARVTALPAAIAAVMVGSGEIKRRGIVPPEDAMEGNLYDKFLEELKKRDITIVERISYI
jgi:lysine 6-dehydrogenase